MNIVRMAFAFGIIYFVTFFLFANILTTTGGANYSFFFLAILCFLLLVTLSGDLLQFLMPRVQTFFLLIFLGYYIFKFYFETGDYEATKQIVIGTSHGTVFSYVMGLACAYALGTFYSFTKNGNAKLVQTVLIFIFLGLVLFETYSAFQSQLTQVRGDLFLTEDTDLVGTYQRRGDFIIIQFLLAISVAILLISTQKTGAFLVGVILFFIIGAIAFLSGAISQILGSNKGLISTLGFTYIFIVMLCVFSMKHSFKSNIKISNMLFGPLAFKLAIGGAVSLVLVAIMGFVAVTVLKIDVSTLRITGYGAGESGSVVSRSAIFRMNFIPHFSYNPIFGHTQVEELAEGGDGNYIHSIFSILTHLGLVGGILFFLMLFFSYLSITTRNVRSLVTNTLSEDNRYGLFRLLTLSATILMCAYSAFFNWMPLWFALGLFGEWFHFRHRAVSVGSNRRSKSRRRRSV